MNGPANDNADSNMATEVSADKLLARLWFASQCPLGQTPVQRPSHDKFLLANLCWPTHVCVCERHNNMLADCWQQIELVSSLANFFSRWPTRVWRVNDKQTCLKRKLFVCAIAPRTPCCELAYVAIWRVFDVWTQELANFLELANSCVSCEDRLMLTLWYPAAKKIN